MVAAGVFVAATDGVLVAVRSTMVFVLTSVDSDAQEVLQFEVLQGTDSAVEPTEAADDDEGADKKQATPPASPVNRITAVQLFRAQGSNLLALLLLVDARRLVHYELDVVAKTLKLQASRAVPRSATCMTVGHLNLPSGEIKYVVLIGQKTGEAVAMPFPDVDRDLKTLLGHSTSMVTHVAVNHDSSLLLTADRDEKLRVSRFPNASIIESYCLGHTASLTKIACSTVTPELVVSTSMDNTVKLWQMKSGKLFASEPLLSEDEVALESFDEADSDNSGRMAATSLINVSLAICPKTNIVAVLVNHQFVRFFEIVAGEKGHTLKEVVGLNEDIQSLLANEPCELLFTNDKRLVVAYKRLPFLQLFAISTSENGYELKRVDTAVSAFDDFRIAAAKIELADDEDKTLGVLEGGLKKKKARTGKWNKKGPDADE